VQRSSQANFAESLVGGMAGCLTDLQTPQIIPRTLPTADSDRADATRGYPPDSTDDSNSLIQITFQIALSVKSELQSRNETVLMPCHG
jgi:hypothetical protein